MGWVELPKNYDKDEFVFIAWICILATVAAWITSLVLLIIGDIDNAKLVFYLALALSFLFVLAVLSYTIGLVDDEKIVIKTLLKRVNAIRWDDVARVELRFFNGDGKIGPGVNSSVTVGKAPKVEYYVFFSKTKKDTTPPNTPFASPSFSRDSSGCSANAP